MSDQIEARTSERADQAKLYAKLVAVAGEVEALHKDGYNPQLRYKYATPSAVMVALKPLLAKHKLAIIPSVVNVHKEDMGTKTQSGAGNVLTRVEMTFLLLDGETGAHLDVPWVGEGSDWSDKGVAKAETIAMRTFLLNAFQIPTEDEETDPDRGGSNGQAHGRNDGNGRGGQRQQSAPTPQRPQATPAPSAQSEPGPIPPPAELSRRYAEAMARAKELGVIDEFRTHWVEMVGRGKKQFDELAPGVQHRVVLTFEQVLADEEGSRQGAASKVEV
jgi:hypothetical protein